MLLMRFLSNLLAKDADGRLKSKEARFLTSLSLWVTQFRMTLNRKPMKLVAAKGSLERCLIGLVSVGNHQRQ